MPQYLLDTNVFIQAHNGPYAMDIRNVQGIAAFAQDQRKSAVKLIG
jgi:hypothetical protein